MAECCADVLRLVLVELQAIRQALERDRPSSLGRADRKRLERLLPAIGGAVGSEMFTASELLAGTHPGVRVVCGDLTPKSLGKLLRRAERLPIAGLMVVDEGREAGAVLWRVVGVPECARR